MKKQVIQKKWFIFRRKAKKWFYALNKQPLYTEEQKVLFDKAKVGDIIYSRMPLSEEEMYDIPKGHQNRPYLIAGKKDYCLMAYPAYHKWPGTIDKTKCFVMKGRDYQRYYRMQEVQDSYFNLSVVYALPIENLIYWSGRLNMHDLCEAERRLKVGKNIGSNVCPMNVDVAVRVGDICEMPEGLYYVYAHENGKYYTHQMGDYAVDGRSFSICFNGMSYFIDVGSSKIFEHISDFPVVWFCDDNMIDMIAKRKKAVGEEKQLLSPSSVRKPFIRFYVDYPFGQQFYFPFNDEIVIYLYNVKGKSYGVFLHEFEEGNAKIRKLQDMEYMKLGEMTPVHLMREVVEHLVRLHRDPEHIVEYLWAQSLKKETAAFA